MALALTNVICTHIACRPPLPCRTGCTVAALGRSAVGLVFAIGTTSALLLTFVRLEHTREAFMAEMLASGKLKLASFTRNAALMLMIRTRQALRDAALVKRILHAVHTRRGGSAFRAFTTVTFLGSLVIPNAPVVVISGTGDGVLIFGVLPEVLIRMLNSSRVGSWCCCRGTSHNYDAGLRSSISGTRLARVFDIV